MSGHLPNVMNPNLSILLSKAMRHVGLTIFPSYVPRSNGQWTVDSGLFCVHEVQIYVLQSRSLLLSSGEETRQPQNFLGAGWRTQQNQQDFRPQWRLHELHKGQSQG